MVLYLHLWSSALMRDHDVWIDERFINIWWMSTSLMRHMLDDDQSRTRTAGDKQHFGHILFKHGMSPQSAFNKNASLLRRTTIDFWTKSSNIVNYFNNYWKYRSLMALDMFVNIWNRWISLESEIRGLPYLRN